MALMDAPWSLDFGPVKGGAVASCATCRGPINRDREWKRRDAGVRLSNGYVVPHDVDYCSEDCEQVWLMERLSFA